MLFALMLRWRSGTPETNMAAVFHKKDVWPPIQTDEKDADRTAALTG
jgi:hypothetical protein